MPFRHLLILHLLSISPFFLYNLVNNWCRYACARAHTHTHTHTHTDACIQYSPSLDFPNSIILIVNQQAPLNSKSQKLVFRATWSSWDSVSLARLLHRWYWVPSSRSTWCLLSLNHGYSKSIHNSSSWNVKQWFLLIWLSINNMKMKPKLSIQYF
jgi:hypothetical protein